MLNMKHNLLNLARAAFALLLITGAAKGQTLGIAPCGLAGFPDSTAENSVAGFSFYVKNTGSAGFYGTFDVQYSVNGEVQPDLLFSSESAVNISPGDSVQVQVIDFFFPDSVFLPSSINIVVVWPVSASPTSDSLAQFIYILESPEPDPPLITSMGENTNNKNLFLSPNPTPGRFRVTNAAQGSIKAMSIYDSSGAKLLTTSRRQADIAHLPGGLYMVDVVLVSGERRLMRIVKH
jgi:hypothetical protein